MSQTPQKSSPVVHFVRLFFSGFLMGSADVVPGVSGGTMAFILGIYQELIEAIRKFTAAQNLKLLLTLQFKKLLKDLPWRFILPLFLGIISAIVLTASGIKWLLENRPSQIWAFFFGLVLASILCVINRVKCWKIDRILVLAIGAAAAWILVGLPFSECPPNEWWYLILCGAVAICAMILPGISGSFILVLMGKYDTVIGAVHHLKTAIISHDWSAVPPQLAVLGLFVVGVVIGLASFVRLLSWLLKKHPDLTIAALIGFMAGSLRKVWPWKAPDGLRNILPDTLDGGVAAAAALAVLGFILVFVIEKTAERRTEKAK